MASVLAAIRAAMHGDAETYSPTGDATGAAAPIEKDEAMSTNDQPAGGTDKNAGISKAEHDAAVTAAETKGHAAGVKAGTDRLNTALGADGVKGDSGRMAAALDLAVKSPAMSGEDVAAFVIANIAAASASDAKAYETGRLADAALARPHAGAEPGKSGTASWADFRARKAG